MTGTAVSPVLFTSNQTTKTRGYWGRLEFTSATDAATTVLDHFTVEYGGYGGFGTVYVNASTPTFRNGTIRESNNYGIYLSGTSGSLVLESTTVQNNTNTGIHVNQGSLSVQDVTFSGTESTYAMSMPAATQVTATGTHAADKPIELRSGNINQNTSWHDLGGAYVLTGNINVYKDATTAAILTVKPGVEVRFNQNLSLSFGFSSWKGALSAVGTADEPIVFTSNQTTKTAGYWSKLYFLPSTDSAATVLEHVLVEYGGYGGFGTIQVNGCSPTIKNSTIRHSSNHGIYVSGTGASPFLRDNNFTYNATYAINNTTTSTLDARASWWNHASGPSGSGPGSGDAISANVLYEPWLEAAQNPHFFVGDTEITEDSFDKNFETTSLIATFSGAANWTLQVVDSSATVVKTFTGSGTSVNQAWGGEQDGTSQEVPEGTYTLRLTGTESATSEVMAPLAADVIVVGSDAPVAVITAPANGAVLRGGETITVTGTASDPNDFVSYRVERGVGASPSSWSVITSPPDVTTPVTSGTLASWTTTFETFSTYTLRLKVTDATSPPATSQVTVSLMTIHNYMALPQYFSPDGNGVNDTTTLSATLTLNANWTLKIKDAGGVAVRTFTGTGTSISQVWDGKDDGGSPVPEGNYLFVFEAVEPGSGVEATPRTGLLKVDVSPPTANITAPSESATVFDTVSITGTASDTTGFYGYVVEYGEGTSPTVWTNVATQFVSVVNGSLANWLTNSYRDEIPVSGGNGVYTIRLTVNDLAGNAASDQVSVDLDNLFISNVTRTNPILDPTLGTISDIGFTLNRDVATAKLRIVPEVSALKVYPDQSVESNAVRTIDLGALLAGAQSTAWDGQDDAENYVPDDAYIYLIEAQTASGRFDKFNQYPAPSLTVPVPPELVFPAASAELDPYKNEFLSHEFTMSQSPARSSFRVEYTNSQGQIFTLWPQYKIVLTNGTNTVFWDGRNASGNIVTDIVSINYYISDFIDGCNPCGFAQHLNFTGIKKNYIVVEGGKPDLPGVSIKSDPYLIHLSYGQIAHLRYTLGRDANVTVTVRDPMMATVATLLSNEFQAAGEQEVVWDGTTFTGQLPATPGHYTFSMTATDPVTGASVTRRGNVTVFK